MAVTDTWWIGWQHRAACRGEVASLFFPDNAEEPRDERKVRESQAKAICARCEVRDKCLDYALRTREPYGVWGGLNEYERRALLRERDKVAG
ncbi:MAG: WhiB family transcriptional regulator [Actinobacteria bacterium]|nr:WhiB family transcriptional regulator [Actinomycetota bacterium]